MLPDHKTGISVRIATHAARRTRDQWGSIGVSLGFLALFIASYEATATSALTTGISWIDPTGEDAFGVCLILGIREDASLHPIGPFLIAAFAILAAFRPEI